MKRMRDGIVKGLSLLGCLTVVLASPAWAQDPERIASGRVAFTTDVTLVRGCTLLGRVKDDSIKDLRRKIVRLGGDTAVVAFGYEEVHADAYRCPAPRAPLPPGTVPPNVPPPPAGAPPPPPPPARTPSPSR
jgi:hypothetical protein